MPAPKQTRGTIISQKNQKFPTNRKKTNLPTPITIKPFNNKFICPPLLNKGDKQNKQKQNKKQTPLPNHNPETNQILLARKLTFPTSKKTNILLSICSNFTSCPTIPLPLPPKKTKPNYSRVKIQLTENKKKKTTQTVHI